MILEMVIQRVLKSKKKSTLYFTLLSTLFILVNVSYGQVYYKSSYHHAAGNPAGLNMETDNFLDNTWNVVSTVGYSNNWTSPIAIPFPFEFYGNPVSSLTASRHGLISFSPTTLLPDPNLNLPASTLPNNTISVLWETYIAPNAYYYYYGEIATKTFGTTPNRQFWITWKDWPLALTESNDFACVLEETTNNIYIVDKYIADKVTLPQVTATVGVQLNDSTASQYGDKTIVLTSPTSMPNDNNYYLFEPTPYPSEDAGITGLVSPTTTILPGTKTVEVTLKNYGTADLDSVRIFWSINGAQQTPVYWSGPSIAQGLTTNVPLGTYTFASGFHELKAWTELPNGNLDSIPANDEFEVSICTPFQGTYTVGPNADFEDIDKAVAALDCGITGPVTFNVTNDYFGMLCLHEVQGASAINTITFNGGSPKARIYYLPGAGENSVIEMKSADHVTFNDFIIYNLSATGGNCVYLQQGADHNTFSNCDFSHGYSPYYYNYTNNVGIVAACNYLTVKDCSTYESSTSVILNGSSSNIGVGNRLLNNYFYSIQEGIRASNQDSLEIIGNELKGFNQTAIIDASFLNQFKINKNDCYSRSILSQYQTGIYIYASNLNTAGNNNSEFNNNMVIGNLDFSDLHKTNIFHNTVYTEQVPLVLNYGNYTDLDIRNNIFMTSDHSSDCMEINDTSFLQNLDYNLYYNTNTNNATFWIQGTYYNSLASLQAALPQFNANSISQDPMFINPFDNLHIQPNPAINNLALPLLNVTDDIDGDARPSPNEIGVDMGADEIPSPTYIDLALTKFVSPFHNTICGKDSIPIIVKVHNIGTPVNNVTIDATVSGVVSGSFTKTLPVVYSNQTLDIMLGMLPTNSTGVFSTSATVYHPITGNAMNTIQQQTNLSDTIEATATVTHETSAGANDGSITIQSILGGAPPYSILWNTGQTTMSISNLSPNTYSAVVTSGSGCQTTVNETVDAYLPTYTITAEHHAEILLYPNPANGRTTLSVSLQSPKPITVRIFNSIGQELKTVHSSAVLSKEFDLDLSELENGIYLVKTTIDRETITRKLLLYK